MNSNMILALAFWIFSLIAMVSGKTEWAFYLILIAILNALISIARAHLK